MPFCSSRVYNQVAKSTEQVGAIRSLSQTGRDCSNGEDTGQEEGGFAELRSGAGTPACIILGSSGERY